MESSCPARAADTQPLARRVIVNADDFGFTSGVNRGIIEAHEHGILTSASLMVRYPAAEEAAAYAKTHTQLSVGLHFEAGEWRYETGEWRLAYQVIDADNVDAVRAELARQLDEFERLIGRAPTHLDSHQHMHLSEPARAIFVEAADRLRVPVRSCTPAVVYNGGFYGQTTQGEPYPEGISADHLARLIESLPAGWTELGAHPGYADALDSVYALEREQEVRALCAPQVREALASEEVQLCSFHNLSP